MTHQTTSTSGHHSVDVIVTATMTVMIVMIDMREKAVWHVMMNMRAGVLLTTGHYLVAMAGNSPVVVHTLATKLKRTVSSL